MRPALLGGVVRSSKSLDNYNHQTQDLNFKTTSTNTNATPTRARPSRPSLRPPLQARDSNANMMRVPPLTAKGSINMPPDKHNASRPLMPTLGAASKASNRSPLTPRVAGSTQPAVKTPSSRRAARPESYTPAGSKEDIPTPVSTFLSNNITPRSGSRKGRVDSTNTTPTGTPVGTPAPSTANDAFRSPDNFSVYSSGLGITGIDKDIPKRATVSFSPSVINGESLNTQSDSADSKFFFASDAKTSTQPARPPLPTKNSSSFFYANGESIPNRPQSSSASAVGSALGSTIGEDRPQSKFLYANGAPDMQASPPPHLPPPRASSVVSSASRMTAPRVGTASPSAMSPPQRPASPSKLSQYASISSVQTTPALPSPVLPRPSVVGRGQSASTVVSARRASIEIAQRLNHGRSTSIGSADGKLPPPVRKISGGSYESSAPASPLSLITTSVPVSTPEEVVDDQKESGMMSPIKTGHSMEELNELAANARRERKVLDLEITNSSLAAINRTLEREMRKQTAELRRYRRLSRSGRLSIATSASMRSSNGSMGGIDSITGLALSDMSEEDEEESDEESELSEEETSDEGSLSPSAMEESDLRHRKRDEKRLQLDLSKHQQLLIDSQKMNQSLKRCLGWTEELINEGRKALEYRVRVSDVELGGRVLAPDEIEGADADADANADADDAGDEGMSGIGARMVRQARKAAANVIGSPPLWGAIGSVDRDSGIELDGAQREQMSNAFATLEE